MSFHRPRFIGGGGGGAADPEDLPIIHESAPQGIQGGISGEHFHLTAQEYLDLNLDLVCAGGELVFSGGDIVRARNAA